jgi:4a-hydroxytetrahydrobiopterin dehydratase
MAERLSAPARAEALERLSAWRHDEAEDAIVRDIKLGSFSEAFAFMTRVAMLAESADHHPTWTNTYDRVSIRLSTHDAGGLTNKDIDLATAIDALLG